MNNMFDNLNEINHRPEPFQFYTAEDLWTDEYISRQMLAYHLNPDIDVSSRRKDFIEQSVEWIALHFNLGDETRIADFGCGPGLYTTRLAKLGARVTGIDFSKRSVEYARKVAEQTGLDIEYINQNYLDFKTTDQFNLITMIMCDYCVLSPSQRKVMLTKFHHLLLPGGAVLLDVYSLNAFQQRKETSSYGNNLLDGFWSDQPYYGFKNTFKYNEDKVVLDKYTIIEAERTRVIYNWLQFFSPESLQREFEEAGFRKYELYADVAGEPFDQTSPEFAIVGRK
ncbi:MAG: class I SAM-dependent methyltransferase [bacterium]